MSSAEGELLAAQGGLDPVPAAGTGVQRATVPGRDLARVRRPDPLRRALLGVLLLGAGLRAVLVVTTTGLGFDIDSYRIVDAVARRDPLHLYSIVNAFSVQGITVFRWPYLPGYLPAALLAGWLERHASLAFATGVKVWPALADLAIAAIVDRELRRRHVPPSTRLLGVIALVLGPVPLAVSAYHGQLDAVAVLWAVVGLVLWEAEASPRHTRSALLAGGLVGLAALVKPTPGLTALGLLGAAARTRERLALLLGTLAVPLVATLPFLVADPTGVLRLREYSGVLGLGGLSMFLQPGLVATWLHTGSLGGVAPATLELARHGSTVTAVALLVVAALAARRRLHAVEGALALALTVVVAGSGFAYQYLVWALPLLVLSGRVRAALLLQALATPPMVLFYGRIGGPGATALYLVTMTLLWVTALALLVSVLSTPWRGEETAVPTATR